MKTITLMLLLAASPVLAQTTSPVNPAACGPASTTFSVDDSGKASLPAPPPPTTPPTGKALVFFIQDNGPLGDFEHFTLKNGLDGAWVGASKHNAYLSAVVDPGEHHVCVAVQTVFKLARTLELAHFTAEPGKTYYFRSTFVIGRSSQPYLVLTAPDSDEANYLLGLYPPSVWHEKK